jgi:CRISPR-associated protein Cmr6
MPAEHEYVPLMFQAQIGGRSQIQRLIPKADRQQAYDWAKQWQEACDRGNVPEFEAHVQTRPCKFPWRMVTNSGQDAGVIRPVIGERGWAFFPGSSMKGAFLRACKRLRSPDEVHLFCGGLGEDGELHPGVLRFHGGYPKDAKWLDDSLVDIAHPQEDWQTKNQGSHSAFIQISLYQPTFIFGISSTTSLSDDQWQTIWQVWQAALEQGLGSRVSAGYGQIATHTGNNLVTFELSGQGATSRRIDRVGEFRPNLFKAALRGHTRRLFNGITDEPTADRMTKLLWGGIGKSEDATLGLLGISFRAEELELDEWIGNNRNNRVPTYNIEKSTLEILLMRHDLSDTQRKELKVLVIQLMKFAMLLGGFGKSWRRADHQMFMPKYKNQMIGCHWQFLQRSSKCYIPFEDDMTAITEFLKSFHRKGKSFSWLPSTPGTPTPDIREAWRPDNAQVWGRLADGRDDSQAIKWLHGPYKSGQTIKPSDLTGKMGQIGRLWHRMYPRFEEVPQPDGKTRFRRKQDQYAELLTIFPNVEGNTQRQIAQDFLKFLGQETDFKQLW